MQICADIQDDSGSLSAWAAPPGASNDSCPSDASWKWILFGLALVFVRLFWQAGKRTLVSVCFVLIFDYTTDGTFQTFRLINLLFNYFG